MNLSLKENPLKSWLDVYLSLTFVNFFSSLLDNFQNFQLILVLQNSIIQISLQKSCFIIFNFFFSRFPSKNLKKAIKLI